MCTQIAPPERGQRTDLENGMVRYVAMKTYRDTKDIKLAKSRKSAESAIKCRFQCGISQ